MRSNLFFCVLLMLPLPALADTEKESATFNISTIEQSCKRKNSDEPYSCIMNIQSPVGVSVELEPVKADQLEEQAFEGKIESVGLTAGGYGQYIGDLVVHKSLAFGGRSVIYFITLQVHKYTNGTPTIFKTVAQIQDHLTLKHPILLPTERTTSNDRAFSEISFELSQGE